MSDRLTRAQRDALRVLVLADGPMPGGKRRSTLTPVPRVNSTSALALCRMGLARCTEAYEFVATDAGRAEHGKLRKDHSMSTHEPAQDSKSVDEAFGELDQWSLLDFAGLEDADPVGLTGAR